jgi:hypothetical protein
VLLGATHPAHEKHAKRLVQENGGHGMNSYAEVLTRFLAVWKLYPDAPPSEYSTLRVHCERHMPLTKVEVTSFKLALRELSPADFYRLFPDGPACDPALYLHEKLFALDLTALDPIPCEDGVVTADVLRDLRATFERLGLPVRLAIQGDELHLRFRHLPSAIIQCMDDLETDTSLAGHNMLAEMRLKKLVKRLVPGLDEKLVVVK